MDIVAHGSDEGGSLSPRIDAHSNDDGVKLIQIEYGGRRMVTSWTDNWKEFKERAPRLFNIPEGYTVKLIIHVVYKGSRTSIVLEDAYWPFVEDQFRVIQLIAEPPPEFTPTGTETVLVKMLTGKTIWISGLDFRSHTVWNMKSAVVAREGIPLDQQIVRFQGRQLVDSHTLEHCNITAGSVIHLILRLRGGWGWVSFLRERKQTHGPLPRPRRLDPSQFVRENFICLHYQQRKILTSWDADFMAFKANACQLLQISAHHQVDFHVELSSLGDGKMEVDPRTWPRLEGLISNVWARDAPTSPHSSEPTTSDIAKVFEPELENIPSSPKREPTGSPSKHE